MNTQKGFVQLLAGIVIGLVIVVGAGLIAYEPEQNGPVVGSFESRIAGVAMTYGSTSIATSTTKVADIPTGVTYFRVENDGGSDIYCVPELLTAASSSLAINTGIKLTSATSTGVGQSWFELGPDAALNYAGGQFNCRASGVATRLIYIYK